MPDELRLPDELASLEARLAAQSLPPSGVNRDELMFRAGWAACEARTAASVPPPSKGGVRGGIPDLGNRSVILGESTLSITPLTHPLPAGARGLRTLAWSLASAATAASLAVAITLRMSPPEGGVVAVAQPTTPSVQAAAAAPSSSEVQGAGSTKVVLTSLVLPRRFSAAASLLMARDQVLQRQSSDLPIYPVINGVAAGDGLVQPEQTSRQLLDEFVPRRRSKTDDKSPRRLFDWPWSATTEGERI